MPKFIYIKEICELLGISRWTIYRWVRENKDVPIRKRMGRYVAEANALSKWYAETRWEGEE